MTSWATLLGMERLALIGVSQRRGGLEALEAWTAWFLERPTRTLAPALVSEAVLIRTCNRCDLVIALPEGTSLEAVRSRLVPPGQSRGYAFAGEAALEHLFRVASSLDSLNPGEDQIMNQVRHAFEDARGSGTVGPVTGFAFNAALRAAKRVRREVALAPANSSLYSLARPEFERLLPQKARVAVLGAGEMGALAARSLSARPDTELLIVNRSLEKAQALAATLNARAVRLEDFWHDAPAVDGLVCATPALHIVDEAFLARQPQLRAITDLGLPRNVDPAVAARVGVALIDLERLRELGEQRRELLRVNLIQAEDILALELETALGEWAERSIGRAIAQLREVYRTTIERTVGDLLSPEDVDRLAHRFAHLPVKGLRGLARQRGADAARVFLTEAGLIEADEPALELPSLEPELELMARA
jgi:glutamyl-tRNA reductase